MEIQLTLFHDLNFINQGVSMSHQVLLTFLRFSGPLYSWLCGSCASLCYYHCDYKAQFSSYSNNPSQYTFVFSNFGQFLQADGKGVYITVIKSIVMSATSIIFLKISFTFAVLEKFYLNVISASGQSVICLFFPIPFTIYGVSPSFSHDLRRKTKMCLPLSYAETYSYFKIRMGRVRCF